MQLSRLELLIGDHGRVLGQGVWVKASGQYDPEAQFLVCSSLEKTQTSLNVSGSVPVTQVLVTLSIKQTKKT